MKKRSSLFVAIAFGMMTILGAPDAGASGFGLYGSFGEGTPDWHIDGWADLEAQPPGSLGYPSSEFKADSLHRGGGLVFDTAVAKDRLLNYRLNLGYDAFRNKDRLSGAVLSTLRGWVISNTFGFGIVRTGGFRLWLGPEIRLAWQSGVRNEQLVPWREQEYDLLGMGIGPALGMNVNFPGRLTVAVTAGYQYVSYYGQMGTTVKDGHTDVDVDERIAYVTFGFLLRTSDDR